MRAAAEPGEVELADGERGVVRRPGGRRPDEVARVLRAATSASLPWASSGSVPGASRAADGVDPDWRALCPRRGTLERVIELTEARDLARRIRASSARGRARRSASRPAARNRAVRSVASILRVPRAVPRARPPGAGRARRAPRRFPPRSRERGRAARRRSGGPSLRGRAAGAQRGAGILGGGGPRRPWLLEDRTARVRPRRPSSAQPRRPRMAWARAPGGEGLARRHRGARPAARTRGVRPRAHGLDGREPAPRHDPTQRRAGGRLDRELHAEPRGPATRNPMDLRPGGSARSRARPGASALKTAPDRTPGTIPESSRRCVGVPVPSATGASARARWGSSVATAPSAPDDAGAHSRALLVLWRPRRAPRGPTRGRPRRSSAW